VPLYAAFFQGNIATKRPAHGSSILKSPLRSLPPMYPTCLFPKHPLRRKYIRQTADMERVLPEYPGVLRIRTPRAEMTGSPPSGFEFNSVNLVTHSRRSCLRFVASVAVSPLLSGRGPTNKPDVNFQPLIGSDENSASRASIDREDKEGERSAARRDRRDKESRRMCDLTCVTSSRILGMQIAGMNDSIKSPN